MVKLFTTDSYFNLFNILTDELKEKDLGEHGKRLIFCESKISLMTERHVCSIIGGTFNTEVYSFGNFLRIFNPSKKTLTKEGAVMVVKRILSKINLNCYKASKTTLAPSIYNLIIQLKSAKVSTCDLEMARDSTSGILKDKLCDLVEIYNAYEDYLQENGLDDQSSFLSKLPETIMVQEKIKGADVYIIGYDGFTEQIRRSINALIDCANSVTAILVQGDNPMVFVNETAEFIKKTCKQNGYPITVKRVESNYLEEAKLIVDNLFCPSVLTAQKFNSDKIYFDTFENPIDEVETVAENIRYLVSAKGYRYSDFTISLPNVKEYAPIIEKAFKLLQVPYYIDVKKQIDKHPLIRLIINYLELFCKGIERKKLAEFFKNPLYCENKNLADKFENYLIKYNVNYNRIKKSFALTDGDISDSDFNELESFRASLCGHLDKPNVKKLLEDLDVKNKLENLSISLEKMGEKVESSINAQVYEQVQSILDQMDSILSGVNITLTEYKNLFYTGVLATELSVIPQYSDAVFIGDYKQVSLSRAKHLFMLGLTSDVPSVQEDVALLSNSDVAELEQIKVLIEPKISVVNQRARESLALALCAFSERVYLTFPISTISGSKNIRSQIISEIQALFNTKAIARGRGYQTVAQATLSFAKACGDFAETRIDDFTIPSSFYCAKGGEDLDYILNSSNVQVKVRLDGQSRSVIADKISPTTIENYYKCPYASFVSKTLSVNQREQGEIDALSVGNLIHDLLNEYAKNIEKVRDKVSSDEVFYSALAIVLEKNSYKKYIEDAVENSTLDRIIREAKEYAYKTYLSFENSDLKIKECEAYFGDNGAYPPILLKGGKIKMHGKIDRVDCGNGYFRVIDYKTGSASKSLSKLYSGEKLQLYLYAHAVKSDKSKAMSPLGVYYLPISDAYVGVDVEKEFAVGRTIDEKEALTTLNKGLSEGCSSVFGVKINEKGKVSGAISSQSLNDCISYAVSMAEQASEQMSDGVIVPSPIAKACDTCPFGAMCGVKGLNERSVPRINEADISNALQEGGTNEK